MFVAINHLHMRSTRILENLHLQPVREIGRMDIHHPLYGLVKAYRTWHIFHYSFQYDKQLALVQSPLSMQD